MTVSSIDVPIIDVIGTPCDGQGWGLAQQKLIGAAATVIAASRWRDELLSLGVKSERIKPYPSPFAALLPMLQKCQGATVVIASGDPLYFGVGNWLQRHRQQIGCTLRFYPAVSSVQMAAAALGVGTHRMKTISLHGRPMSTLAAQLNQKGWYMILCDRHSTPQAVAQTLCDLDQPEVELAVFERMSSQPAQPRLKAQAQALLHDARVFDALSVIAFYLPTPAVWRYPGLTDALWQTDVGATTPNSEKKQSHAEAMSPTSAQSKVRSGAMMTKREVRLAVLSRLLETPALVSWDLGAGCGSVTVEWALWSQAADTRIYAAEKARERFEALRQNCDRFGVSERVSAYHGDAPKVCESWPEPQAVFIGGHGGTLADLLRYSWSRLAAKGHLVAVSVAENSRATLHEWNRQCGLSAQVTQLSVAQQQGGTGTAAHTVMLRPSLPVVIYHWQKPVSSSTQ